MEDVLPPAEAPHDFDLANKSPEAIVTGWREVSAEWEKDFREGNFQGLELGETGYSPTKEVADAYAEQAKVIVQSDPEKARGLLNVLDSAVARSGLPDEQDRENAVHDQLLLGHLLVDLTLQFPGETTNLWAEVLSGVPDGGVAANELFNAITEQRLPPDIVAKIVGTLSFTLRNMAGLVNGAYAWMQHSAARRLGWPEEPRLIPPPGGPYPPASSRPEWRGGDHKWLTPPPGQGSRAEDEV